ncbi:hypothetical protein ED236_00380 [Pseudomethylobacillus aquaticus]|uniref:Uncharacterized protein n=1 Tax=Pseudomethylobacillus aquaticus TaxID=2676064 RepID=A0A3N0V5N5_9PROT|nr:hypothetical protein [Pseudomethylobacillus aquaticus]ROH87985.1 hypothetical protein ED236_00380 [Pseudomethylobacillus aquaticus]
MTCELCQRPVTYRYNFNNRCCLVRWLRRAYPEHAKSYLDQYQILHGRAAMLELIEAAKKSESKANDS